MNNGGIAYTEPSHSLDTTVATFQTKQELAFCGHDESDDSLNPGNFKAIWELILKSTPELNDHCQKKIYFRGISKTIQNELIDLVKDEIHIFIENAINNSTFFACILDETTDITERAQCSIVCRLVDTKGVVQEYFLGFFDLGEDRSAPALRDLLFSVIGKFDCKAKLIAQTYDGASVMSGQLNGLQK
ncbi:zinc finger MYM-type protein 1-like [Diabrotica undecimpunctata]|uniref:zinc finger MYM-type protein 1-like n=1 Tax=Diabrotica undecimpunctata TaxID=50387 RepID=UPI003B639E26